MIGLIASATIVAALAADQPLPVVDVKLHSWGVEFIGSDGTKTDRDMWVVDTIAFDVAIDGPFATEPDIWDCIDAARSTCTFGVKRFYFSAGPPAVCEFECYGGTGGGS